MKQCKHENIDEYNYLGGKRTFCLDCKRDLDKLHLSLMAEVKELKQKIDQLEQDIEFRDAWEGCDG